MTFSFVDVDGPMSQEQAQFFGVYDETKSGVDSDHSSQHFLRALTGEKKWQLHHEVLVRFWPQLPDKA